MQKHFLSVMDHGMDPGAATTTIITTGCHGEIITEVGGEALTGIMDKIGEVAKTEVMAPITGAVIILTCPEWVGDLTPALVMAIAQAWALIQALTLAMDHVWDGVLITLALVQEMLLAGECLQHLHLTPAESDT